MWPPNEGKYSCNVKWCFDEVTIEMLLVMEILEEHILKTLNNIDEAWKHTTSNQTIITKTLDFENGCP